MAVEAVSERGGGGCAAAGAGAIEGDNAKPANQADAAAPPGNATHAFFSNLLENRPLVLMADDQVALTTVASLYLEELGMRVLLASDGFEALRLAFEHHPDLIIIDVRMPLLDGLQVVQQLRSCDNPRLTQVPVICISGYSGPGEEDRCIASGATRFLKKPFGLPQLEKLLHEYLPKMS